ncbi:MAG: YvcK family protein, partial [Erysipelotrichaceae bacterium]|nr:YvcK family protein [Erysipelotrichaceae bacterium]
MKNVVVIGGGTGQSALLKGLKQIENINIATIVTVADDGGSTGRLRQELHIPAMGDVRNVMLALSESESLTASLMDYRFDNNSGQLSGHNLGNIILSALMKKSGSLVQAIDDLDKVLRVRGDVIPSTISNVTLCAHMMDGTVIEGEHNITEAHSKVKDVFYNKYVTAFPDALVAIRQADYIIIGIGSVYTSILPNIIIDDIKKELCAAKGHVIYYCNSMTEEGETDGYSVEDHVRAIHSHIGQDIIDTVIVAEETIP